MSDGFITTADLRSLQKALNLTLTAINNVLAVTAAVYSIIMFFTAALFSFYLSRKNA